MSETRSHTSRGWYVERTDEESKAALANVKYFTTRSSLFSSHVKHRLALMCGWKRFTDDFHRPSVGNTVLHGVYDMDSYLNKIEKISVYISFIPYCSKINFKNKTPILDSSTRQQLSCQAYGFLWFVSFSFFFHVPSSIWLSRTETTGTWP